MVDAIEKDLSGPNPLTRFALSLNSRKWKNIVTIDEAWVYLTDVNGIQKIYYKFRRERSPGSWTEFWKESHPKGVTFLVGVCSRGKTALCFVKPGAKINMLQRNLPESPKNGLKIPESSSFRKSTGWAIALTWPPGSFM
ncbi:hypothetical protein BV898_17502 [Hypsibius exemplaris]|uniref:Uncharacterized protein n=1 Tax=Hypsibius exemplaris TaxID=2072580 RepID=A0A9X6NF63_HYPEX|nr:hypothetical protein BV898_17502 [Hypsibius exemplaris]